MSDDDTQREPAASTEPGGGLETWKRAQNLSVVTLAEGAVLGRLDDFQFDLDSGRIYGWSLKGQGVFAKAGGVRADRLTKIGRDVAFVTQADAVEWGTGHRIATEGRAWADAYRGTPAMTRRGQALGAVRDFVLDAQERHVTGLILHGGQLVALGAKVATGPSAVIVVSREVLVPLAEHAEENSAGWWARLRNALARPVRDDDETSVTPDT